MDHGGSQEETERVRPARAPRLHGQAQAGGGGVQRDAQVGRAEQARVVGRREPQRAEGDMPQVLRRQRRDEGGALRAAPRDRDQQPRQAARRRARLRAKALCYLAPSCSQAIT